MPAYSNSPLADGGRLECAVFRLPREESLPLLLSRPLPIGSGGLSLSVIVGPPQEECSTGPMVTHSASLRNVEAVIQSLVWTQDGPQFPGLAEIVVDGTSS